MLNWKQLQDTAKDAAQDFRAKCKALGQKFSLHRLEDRHLETISKWSKRFAVLGGAHAAIWGVIGLAGLGAIGLHAIGFAVPHVIATAGTIGLLFGLKSLIGSALLVRLHKKCTGIVEKRRGNGNKNTVSPATEPTPAPEKPGKTAETPSVSTKFNPEAGKNDPQIPQNPVISPAKQAPPPLPPG